MEYPLVLIVEDEPQIAEILDAYFQRAGFRTLGARDGDTAVLHHHAMKPDLVILDVRLPRRDGNAVLAEIRKEADTPVIMATAMGEDHEKLAALHFGADDYVVKPFNPLEVVARAKAVLRRTRPNRQDRPLRIGSLELDLAAYEARFVAEGEASSPIDLTLTEFRILACMAAAPRRAFSRSELLEACLPEAREALERTVDSHISNIRRKFAASGQCDFLLSVRGVGYRLWNG